MVKVSNLEMKLCEGNRLVHGRLIAVFTCLILSMSP